MYSQLVDYSARMSTRILSPGPRRVWQALYPTPNPRLDPRASVGCAHGRMFRGESKYVQVHLTWFISRTPPGTIVHMM